ncbi:MAG TPA: hypothetical protein VG269_11690 [Tepidisphaeraceae bacterium]|jgi:hypothetical protein|nr:hypothetical protein [Tepidisphaeraceae bacterium]
MNKRQELDYASPPRHERLKPFLFFMILAALAALTTLAMVELVFPMLRRG